MLIAWKKDRGARLRLAPLGGPGGWRHVWLPEE